MKRINKLPEGFLKTHRTGKKTEVKYLPLALGFLKLEYGFYNEPDVLSLVSFVLEADEDAIAIGPRLEMNLTRKGCDDEVTYITENGVSGLQWFRGEVIWGHTYDDDTPASPGRKVGLDRWIDEMVDRMINPAPEEIEERKRLDRDG